MDVQYSRCGYTTMCLFDVIYQKVRVRKADFPPMDAIIFKGVKGKIPAHLIHLEYYLTAFTGRWYVFLLTTIDCNSGHESHNASNLQVHIFGSPGTSCVKSSS